MPCNTPPPPTMMDEEDEDPTEVLNVEEDDLVVIADHDDSLHSFSHSSTVFCCNFDKAGYLAVTGGQDDRAIVWDTISCQMKFEISGHRDSVIAVDFNYNSTLVASADMDGKIQVWDIASGTHQWDFDTTEITWMAWHPNTNILFAGTIDGSCWKWSVPDGATCDVFPAHGAPSTSGLLIDNGSKCVVGYQDGSVKLWNCDNSTVIGSINEPKGGVLCLACNRDGSLVAAGFEGGSVQLIKSSTFKILHSWNVSEDASIETIGFFKSHQLVAIGTGDGNLNIYDLTTYTLRASTSLDDTIVKVVCAESSPNLYVATGPMIECYDGRSCELLNKWVGSEDRILDLAFSPDQHRFLAASEDNSCKLYFCNG